MKDPWKSIRSQCYGSVEPNVELTAYTDTDPQGIWQTVNFEDIPAYSAGISYDKTIEDHPAAIKLNKQLIKAHHLTPMESIQFNFLITGISKACGNQISRHRIGQGHVSLSRRYTKQQPKFIYPTLEYLENEMAVRGIYNSLSVYCESCFEYYKEMLENGLKKQDARLLMPVNVSTTRHWWINARALRDFLRLRLAPDAEGEIRRLAAILLNIVYTATPSLFEDIVEEYCHEMLTM